MPFLSGKDIKVFYSPSTTDDSIDLSNYKNPYGKYWLLVSGNRWVKNCVRAIKAFDQLFGEHPLLKGKVVILGIRKTSDIVVKINNPNRFIFLGYSNEHALNGLYSNAYALIYPSLNEGFGYPPLEAMHKGCPVIASAVASIPEICGNAVLYFNPYSIPEMKMRILQMEDDSIRPQCIRLGKERQMMIEKKQKEDLDSLCQYILSFLQEDKVF